MESLKTKMLTLIDELQGDFNGIYFELQPEGEDFWHDEYVIAEGLYYDDPDQNYFDHDELRKDFKEFVLSWFDIDPESLNHSTYVDEFRTPELVILFHWDSQELEIYVPDTKQLRKFKNPHPGIRGSIEPLPQEVVAAAAQLDGQIANLDNAIDALIYSHQDIEFYSVQKDGISSILGEMQDGGQTHFWNVIEYDDVLTRDYES